MYPYFLPVINTVCTVELFNQIPGSDLLSNSSTCPLSISELSSAIVSTTTGGVTLCLVVKNKSISLKNFHFSHAPFPDCFALSFSCLYF